MKRIKKTRTNFQFRNIKNSNMPMYKQFFPKLLLQDCNITLPLRLYFKHRKKFRTCQQYVLSDFL